MIYNFCILVWFAKMRAHGQGLKGGLSRDGGTPRMLARIRIANGRVVEPSAPSAAQANSSRRGRWSAMLEPSPAGCPGGSTRDAVVSHWAAEAMRLNAVRIFKQGHEPWSSWLLDDRFRSTSRTTPGYCCFR